MLATGGNAIDAGVASIFAAAVVEISHFGLGGESPIIIYSAKDKRVVVINGQGSAPKAYSPATFARQGCHSWKRSARRDDSRRGGRRRAGAREVWNEVAVGGAGARHRAGGRLPDVHVPRELPQNRTQGIGALRVVDPHLLSRREGYASRADLPPAESRRDAARACGSRANSEGERRHACTGHPGRTRRVLQGLDCPAHDRRCPRRGRRHDRR